MSENSGSPERFQKWLEEQFEQQLRDEQLAHEELRRLLLPLSAEKDTLKRENN